MNSENLQTQCVAFMDGREIVRGDLSKTAMAARRAQIASPLSALRIFDADSSEPVELDLRGSAADVRRRYASGMETNSPGRKQNVAPRAPGRPRLGVTSREVTLLPRHWEWLAAQPGGASAALRRLVEQARRGGDEAGRRRRAQQSVYRFLTEIVGDAVGYEASLRALFAGDKKAFVAASKSWPRDVRARAMEISAEAWKAGESAEGGRSARS